ncbi:ATPase component BioM of energizing module of biotin ECF transporter [Janthinobacterium sp. CG23_2]|nr:ATPase component BioM of energizing module of biotin ECF transporter [Janthinobacterium sp. CG23_2]CUU33116.1 ATPase component BioM of energizing module of biotin ECF transporter [Janthinobacterium sp. CG23_2]
MISYRAEEIAAMSMLLPIAKNTASQPARMLDLLPALVNRHGCITGATGTGKTVTLQVIAEALSGIGVPVFMADVKGDLSGMAKAGSMSEKCAGGSMRLVWKRRSGRPAR